MNLLIAVTGSVAAIKIPEIIEAIKLDHPDDEIEIRVAVTNNARYFLPVKYQGQREVVDHNNGQDDPQEIVFTDEDEFFSETGYTRGDRVTHIELKRWADMAVIVPLSANTLAAIVNGGCTNLVTCIFRAWPFDEKGHISKPIMVFPAMNTDMWSHPLTKKHLDTLRDWGMTVIDPIEKMLACGDVGNGALPEVDEVVKYINSMVDSQLRG